MLTSSSVHRTHMKHPSLVESEISGARLIYSPLQDKFFVLNDSARLIWILLDRHGAFGSDARIEAKRLLSNWFIDPPRSDQIDADLDAAVDLFCKHDLLVKKPDDISLYYNNFPLHESGNKRQYRVPSLVIYDSEWMKENHPFNFYEVAYSDTWNPSTTG